MTASRTEEVFSSTARTYDPARAKLIPCFGQFYASAVAAIPAGTNSVLDLGAGTGLLSSFVRERFPSAALHLVDNSAPMLEQARQRVRSDANVTFETADYTSASLASGYDAIVSALSIHHLADEEKRRLFARIYSALSDRGVFINAEQILAPTPELEAQAKSGWLAEVRALGATEKQIEDSLLRQTEDRCATVANQLNWMRDAGFSNAHCVFEQGRFAVFTGLRT